MRAYRSPWPTKKMLLDARRPMNRCDPRPSGGHSEFWSDVIGSRRAYWLAALAALALLVLTGLFLPLDHDEGQYVAAAWLVHRGLLPFVDFPYLQTPLQPFILAPAAGLVPGWMWLSSRLINAVAVAMGLLY